MQIDDNYTARLSFGRSVRDLRLRLGMTQSELAAAMGFAHPSAICDIEKGRRLIYRDELPRLARALGCDLGELTEQDVAEPAYPLERRPGEACVRR
ncbi:helix-turn-helix transcriptional regulator [Aestuariicoccus sp. MJ-SS9]|uniref:helix-turn-helix domain-containing protein n=1 Tax=Aestuariicoccus sp. MJ-SS9 TaxID=3079855 RepID=UPI002909777E|nr:helix-turn-helix transcriptional regulator [Aestuariicoccus sp. MJ-SS9]MDU8911177.1 helix-turn-helix transcriptional regulator [Aestuariicoccus sp. MJ-SS9]